MKKWINWLYAYYINYGISFVWNSYYWIKNIYSLKETIKQKNEIKERICTVQDIRNEMRKFAWVEDGLFDIYPWVITFLNNDKKDDCDGAAHYGKWLFSLLNIKSKVYHLRNEDFTEGHAICITNDENYLISNTHLVKIDSNDWKTWTKNYFNNFYSIIL